MKSKNVSLMIGLAVFIFTSSQVCVAADEWSDYDLCGTNVEQEVSQFTLTVVDDEWSDYDPCGMNMDQEDINSNISATDSSESSDS